MLHQRKEGRGQNGIYDGGQESMVPAMSEVDTLLRCCLICTGRGSLGLKGTALTQVKPVRMISILLIPALVTEVEHFAGQENT